jgi:hypothetical protein
MEELIGRHLQAIFIILVWMHDYFDQQHETS